MQSDHSSLSDAHLLGISFRPSEIISGVIHETGKEKTEFAGSSKAPSPTRSIIHQDQQRSALLCSCNKTEFKTRSSFTWLVPCYPEQRVGLGAGGTRVVHDICTNKPSSLKWSWQRIGRPESVTRDHSRACDRRLNSLGCRFANEMQPVRPTDIDCGELGTVGSKHQISAETDLSHVKPSRNRPDSTRFRSYRGL